MENHLGFKYSEVVADAGYESEENYLFIEENGQTAYIKPQNYEISKTRKYKKDISRRENMEYHADRDSYICLNGRELTVTNERRSKTTSGYVSVKTYYRSPDCTGCPYKTECIKGNNCKTPMEKRNKVLMVSKTMSQKRAEDLERITSEYGTMLRMNRSIQAVGRYEPFGTQFFATEAYYPGDNVANYPLYIRNTAKNDIKTMKFYLLLMCAMHSFQPSDIGLDNETALKDDEQATVYSMLTFAMILSLEDTGIGSQIQPAGLIGGRFASIFYDAAGNPVMA